ncbi:MAG: hypothetical protein ACRC2J_16355 [Microcoleaceae cyanobacterium]
MKKWYEQKLFIFNLVILNIAIAFLVFTAIFSPTPSMAVSNTDPVINSAINSTLNPSNQEMIISQGKRSKYEYKISYAPGFITSDQERDAIVQRLNTMGNDGWNLIQTDTVFNPTNGSGLYIFIYQREK